MATAYLGIGSNLGDRTAACEEAVNSIGRMPGIELRARSSLYETSPVGGPAQGNYINGVVAIGTEIAPLGLLNVLKSIEKKMGRESAPERDHPRVIDIDILLYGDLVLESPELTVPHPRMHTRCFVLKGLYEIDPSLEHPVTGETIRELWNKANAARGKTGKPI